jgi:hypothetical protein
MRALRVTSENANVLALASDAGERIEFDVTRLDWRDHK